MLASCCNPATSFALARKSANGPSRANHEGPRRSDATARVDRVGLTHLPSGRSNLVPTSQLLKEQLPDAFKAAIANAKLFQMRDRLEEILRRRAKRSLRSRYVLNSLVLIDARRVLVMLSIDHQRNGMDGTLVRGEGDPSRVVGAGKHLSPPHQQEFRTLLALGEAEGDAVRRASSIEGERQSRLLRRAAPQSHPHAEPPVPSAERSLAALDVGKGRVPHQRTVSEQPYRTAGWSRGKRLVERRLEFPIGADRQARDSAYALEERSILQGTA